MPESDRAQSFFFQPVYKRAAIVAAGPMANFILAIVIFAVVFMLYGKQTMSARVDAVQADSAAAAAGFQPGDLVVSIDGQAIGDFEQMQRIVSESAGSQLDIKIDRKGAVLDLKATPALKEIKDNFGNVHRIGILGISRSMAAEDLKFQPVAPPQAVCDGRGGNLVRGRPDAELYRRRRCRPRSGRPTRRPDPDCPDIGPGREPSASSR